MLGRELEDRGIGVRLSEKAQTFLFFTASRPVLEPIQQGLVGFPGSKVTGA
jgi:hypothetical protein